MASFEGKVVAISGGSSGMGLALAKILASRGAKLSICDVVQENLNKAPKEINIQAKDLLTFKCDVRDKGAVHEWINKTVERFGYLSGAANMGVMHCLREELKVMQNQPFGGSIVNAASTAGLVGLTGHSAYCASKHGVVGLTRNCAIDYAKKNIRVNAICPGITETPMQTEIRQLNPSNPDGPEKKAAAVVPMGRLGTATELAQVIAFMLSDEASFVTGSTYTVDGGGIAGY